MKAITYDMEAVNLRPRHRSGSSVRPEAEHLLATSAAAAADADDETSCEAFSQAFRPCATN